MFELGAATGRVGWPTGLPAAFEPDAVAGGGGGVDGGTWLDQVREPAAGPVSWVGELDPSGRMMTELERMPADVVEDDYDAVEVVALWHKLEAYCAARKRLAAADLARRHTMSGALSHLEDLGGRGVLVGDTDVAADELTLRLGLTRRASRRLVRSGRVMAGAGIPTAEALLDGRVDAVKADVILEAVEDLGPDDALDVQEQVLDRAAHLPTGTLRRELATACAQVSPDAFEERCEVAMQQRRVDRPQVLPHGMASLYAVLPAVAATRIYRTVDAAARSAAATGDTRTMDQLRADALAAMAADALDKGWIGTPPREASNASRGAEQGPGRGTGSSGAAGAAPAADTADTRAGSVGSLRMRIGVIGGRSAQVRVVVPLSTAMGGPGGPAAGLPGSNAPAVLEGYGPIPAPVARALAAGGDWRRMVEDPVDRTVHEMSSKAYRPPQSMADLVRAGQPRCVRPGCGVGADACDLNHRIPWPEGATEVANLDPLCRRDHLLVTHAGWGYQESADDRSRTWTTTTGHVYRQTQDGAIRLTSASRSLTSDPPAVLRRPSSRPTVPPDPDPDPDLDPDAPPPSRDPDPPPPSRDPDPPPPY